MMAATLVIVIHFLTGDLFITSFSYDDQETCEQAAQDIQVLVPPGTGVTKQCVESEDIET